MDWLRACRSVSSTLCCHDCHSELPLTAITSSEISSKKASMTASGDRDVALRKRRSPEGRVNNP
ncbi:hypothetical protein BN132_2199 [Cronobacter turicensis 564]|nr:hypothetical protein BN132_2199 [Cronobacter turicensis 564]